MFKESEVIYASRSIVVPTGAIVSCPYSAHFFRALGSYKLVSLVLALVLAFAEACYDLASLKLSTGDKNCFG